MAFCIGDHCEHARACITPVDGEEAASVAALLPLPTAAASPALRLPCVAAP